MAKAVIIDDEINNRELLQQLLLTYCDYIDLVGQAVDVESGIQLIKDKSPEIIFLDVVMPGGDGFQILDAFEKINFKVIFVTSYDQYAIKAIRYAALDYLLKPIDVTELIDAVYKAVNIDAGSDSRIKFLKQNINVENSEIKHIVLSGDKNYQIIKLEDILYIEADGNYVIFKMINNVKHVSSHSLSHYEDLLPAAQFFRIHKSYILNTNAVVSIESGRGGMVLLTNQTELPVAFRRKPAFLELLENKKKQ